MQQVDAAPNAHAVPANHKLKRVAAYVLVLGGAAAALAIYFCMWLIWDKPYLGFALTTVFGSGLMAVIMWAAPKLRGDDFAGVIKQVEAISPNLKARHTPAPHNSMTFEFWIIKPLTLEEQANFQHILELYDRFGWKYKIETAP